MLADDGCGAGLDRGDGRGVGVGKSQHDDGVPVGDVTKGKVFTEGFINAWIDYKFENEVQEIKQRPHPYEFALYYDS